MATIGSRFARNVELPSGYNITPFWDEINGTSYAELNDVSIPSDEAIQKFQIQKLEDLSEAVIREQLHTHGKNAEKLNSLFTSGAMNLIGEYESQGEQQLNTVITEWMKLLNQSYSLYQKDVGTDLKQKEYQRISAYLQQVQEKLQSLINLLSASGNKVLGEYLSQIVELSQKADMNPGDINSWINHMAHLKGDTVEEIGREWIKLKKIPNTETIVTGAVEYRGKKYEHQGQLIQDLMVLQIDNVDLWDSVQISYTVAGSTKTYTETLREFVNHLNNIGKSEKHIMLTDSGYETLMQYSALNIQAKAGINQLPWNKNVSTSVSINDFTDETGAAMLISSKRALTLLRSLDNEAPLDKWVKNTSNDYQAIGNYGLATALSKVLHLDANIGNQYLLTPSGFISFPERMRQLFKTEKYKAYLQGKIEYGKNVDTLGKKHTVNITNHA